MDLISRKVAIETLALNTDYKTPEGIKNDLINHPGKECDWLGGIDEAISIIEGLPTVPAVPLDKLCEWLAERYEPPYALIDIDKLRRPIDFRQQKEIWMAALTKWMEGQDADQ